MKKNILFFVAIILLGNALIVKAMHPSKEEIEKAREDIKRELDEMVASQVLAEISNGYISLGKNIFRRNPLEFDTARTDERTGYLIYTPLNLKTLEPKTETPENLIEKITKIQFKPREATKTYVEKLFRIKLFMLNQLSNLTEESIEYVNNMRYFTEKDLPKMEVNNNLCNKILDLITEIDNTLLSYKKKEINKDDLEKKYISLSYSIYGEKTQMGDKDYSIGAEEQKQIDKIAKTYLEILKKQIREKIKNTLQSLEENNKQKSNEKKYLNEVRKIKTSIDNFIKNLRTKETKILAQSSTQFKQLWRLFSDFESQISSLVKLYLSSLSKHFLKEEIVLSKPKYFYYLYRLKASEKKIPILETFYNEKSFAKEETKQEALNKNLERIRAFFPSFKHQSIRYIYLRDKIKLAPDYVFLQLKLVFLKDYLFAYTLPAFVGHGAHYINTKKHPVGIKKIEKIISIEFDYLPDGNEIHDKRYKKKSASYGKKIETLESVKSVVKKEMKVPSDDASDDEDLPNLAEDRGTPTFRTIFDRDDSDDEGPPGLE